MGKNTRYRRQLEGQKRALAEQIVSLTPTERVLLNETVEWAGKFLMAYAQLNEAERVDDKRAFDEAWGDLATALFLLKEKAQQAHELLDED